MRRKFVIFLKINVERISDTSTKKNLELICEHKTKYCGIRNFAVVNIMIMVYGDVTLCSVMLTFKENNFIMKKILI
jgi:hypothetical protein